MNLPAIYLNLWTSADPAADLAVMADGTLAAVAADLDAAGVSTGIPGIVAGLVEIEIVKRWTLEHAPQGGSVGEGSE